VASFNCISELESRELLTSDFMLLLISLCLQLGVNVRSSRPNYSDSEYFSSFGYSKLARASDLGDLGQFGKPTALNIERSEIPVIAVEDQDTMVGLAVDTIVGMEWLDVEKCRC